MCCSMHGVSGGSGNGFGNGNGNGFGGGNGNGNGFGNGSGFGSGNVFYVRQSNKRQSIQSGGAGATSVAQSPGSSHSLVSRMKMMLRGNHLQ